MTDDGPHSRAEANAPPPPETKPRPRISIVWLIPIVAVLIGGWLVWKTMSEKGPTVTISFGSASGLEAGKTKIKYRDVDVGTVTQVNLSPDLATVVVEAEMSKDLERYLTTDTEFWIVQPRLTASGVSGLGTLLSGSYIGMRPGTPGESKRFFTALAEPPVLDVERPGRRFELKADRIGSVSAGSEIYYRGVSVGIVLDAKLDTDRRGITFPIYILQEYQDLIREKTRFWNASGVRVKVGGAGVTVQTESLQSVLTGGIAFETPLEASNDPPSPAGAEFKLYPDYDTLQQEGITTRIPYLVEFQGSVRGLSVGAPVEFRGMQIGVVTDVSLVLDPERDSYTIPVVIAIEPERATIVGNLKGVKPYDFMSQLVKRGLRAQLASGNLLTGQLVVTLDFFPDAKPAELITGGKYPQIPTVPSNIEVLTSKAQQFLDKLAALPLPQLVDELRKTVRDADQLLSVQAKPAVAKLEPLLTSLTNTSNAARTTLKALDGTLNSVDGMVGDNSRLRYDLLKMIEELTQTARSLRSLSNTVNQQPQSVIFGKEGTPAP